jgi:RecB family exonuclease
VSLRPLVLLTPSLAAAVELPRRLASTGRALAGVYPFKLTDLARAIAEPRLLGRGHRAWDSGHDALLAARLLAEAGDVFSLPAELPRPPVAATLARTLQSLRRAGIPPDRLEAFAAEAGHASGDAERLRALARLYRGFHDALEGRIADPATLFATAAASLEDTDWLKEAEILVADDLELDPVEREFVAALARLRPVRLLRRDTPASLRPTSFRAWAVRHGVEEVEASATPLGPLAPPPVPDGLSRLRRHLFEPPPGGAVEDDSVSLVTAPGEAAEVRSIARRLLAEAARGVPFEDMGVVLPRPETYAPLVTDLLERIGVPHRLHPSLPLRFGRAARSLLLLFRCRGLERGAVMEFLTFAPVPFEEILGPGPVVPARWDALSRDAGIVSGLDRWIVGLRAYAEAEGEAAEAEERPERKEGRARHVREAEALLRVVELLSTTLDGLAGSAPWPDWSERLRAVCQQWIGPERDTASVLEVVADLGSLGSVASHARWEEVEPVIEARFEWERLPLEPLEGGAVHVGALDAMAGLAFRVVAIPGLVEGGYPGVLRPDPFLLDHEREALRALAGGDAREAATPSSRRKTSSRPRRAAGAQMSLFAEDGPETAPGGDAAPPGDAARAASSEGRPSARPSGAPDLPALPTTQDRLLEARRVFHRAVSQATERLILSYPRADARTGRERLPSLFLAAAASTLAGRPLAGADLESRIVEDDLARLPLEDALDAGERDRVRVRAGGRAAAEAIAAGSRFFKQSRLAAQARWSGRLTRYDGLLSELPEDVRERIDPLRASHPISASRLAVYARCGFQYMLQHVLRLEAALEPEERRRLEPLERGTLFHEVAETFLRERRDLGELPVRDTEATRARLRTMAEEALEGLVQGSPPRLTLLWEREKRRFHETALSWLRREAASADRSVPAHFEVEFGLGRGPDGKEPHDPDPIEISIGDGRTLRVSGKIDRIDRRDDGLVLRDYKTGKAPRDDGGVFRGGKQLQIPFYVLAVEKLFPGERVVEAFLDYVDGGRQVAFDPAAVRGERFRALLGSLVDLIAGGGFVQEPAACDFCDFKVVCGPKGLLQRRRQIKIRDATLQAYLRLRDVG